MALGQVDGIKYQLDDLSPIRTQKPITCSLPYMGKTAQTGKDQPVQYDQVTYNSIGNGQHAQEGRNRYAHFCFSERRW